MTWSYLLLWLQGIESCEHNSLSIYPSGIYCERCGERVGDEYDAWAISLNLTLPPQAHPAPPSRDSS